MSQIHNESANIPSITVKQPKRRGRPKTNRPSVDTGTPELVMKKLMGKTAETLDLCLERGIISPEQHWCGIHFRWLYTLRHGAPGVRAIDPTHLGGIENKLTDPEWRQDREREYLEASAILHQSHYAMYITSICVFNERLAFLDYHTPVSDVKARATEQAINDLRAGLEILVSLWR